MGNFIWKCCLIWIFLFSSMTSDMALLKANENTDDSGGDAFEAIYDFSDVSSLDDEISMTSDLLDDESFSSKNFSLSGFVKQEAGYSYQHDDFEFSKLLSTLNLDIGINFMENWKMKIDLSGSYDSAYRIEGRDDFTSDTLDVYESDFRPNELFIDGDLSSWLNIRIGRQYFSWGETEGNQISDIGNPRDLRILGLQNVEDSRLPVGATKATFYGPSWEYNLIAIHEIRPHELGAEGSEFDPFLATRNERTVVLDPDVPNSSLDKVEVLTRLFFSQPWGDISFFGGNVYDDSPILDVVDVNANSGAITFSPEYKKFKSYGFFGNIIKGSGLFKFDVARKIGKPVGRNADNILQQVANDSAHIQSWEPKNLLQWMLGFEYSGLSETFISLEYSGEFIEEHEDVLSDDEFSEEFSVLLTRDFLHDKLATSFWWSRDITDNTDFFRIDLRYDYNDHLEFSLGIIGIETSDKESFFFPYRKTDRITFGIKYGF